MTSVSGFIDLHCHGALGFGFDDADQLGIEAAVKFHRDHGASGVMLSLVSASIPTLVRRLNELQEILPSIPGALGVHLEGPFLAEGRRGGGRTTRARSLGPHPRL